ncbi:MAG: acyl carrier protein [Gemmatimonadales bacterium]
MNRTKIEEQVLEALGAAVPGAKARAIDPALLIRDQVDMDSMDYLDFVLAVERRFSVRVPPASYPLFATVEHAADCVERLLETAAPASAGSTPGRR